MEDLLVDSEYRRWDDEWVPHEKWERQRQYTPTWLNHLHGFHNHKAAANNRAVELIEAHIPKDVQEGDFHDNMYCFAYSEVEVQIETSHDSAYFLLAPRVVHRTFTAPRQVIDPLRRGLRTIVQEEALGIESFLDFVMLMLRLLEETCATFAKPSILAEPFALPQVDKVDNAHEIVKAVQHEIQHWVEFSEFEDGYDWAYQFDDQVFSIIPLQNRAESILGKLKGQICKNIPKE